MCAIEYERPFRMAIVVHDLKKKKNIDIMRLHLSRLEPQDACIISMDYKHPPAILSKPSHDFTLIPEEGLADQFAEEQATAGERLVLVRATMWIAQKTMTLPIIFPLRAILAIVNGI
jgi:hypothetical protein